MRSSHSCMRYALNSPILWSLKLILNKIIYKAYYFQIESHSIAVCKTAVKILFKEVESTDPAKVIEVGSFRLQADGSTRQKKVRLRSCRAFVRPSINTCVKWYAFSYTLKFRILSVLLIFKLSKWINNFWTYIKQGNVCTKWIFLWLSFAVAES